MSHSMFGQGVEGYGQSSPQELEALNKALTVGNDINAPGSFAPGDGFAMRVESLDSVMKNTTFRMVHPRLWKVIPKRAAYNTVEEYNVISEYGNRELGAWMAEGDLPQETDATRSREYVTIKFIGTVRGVSHVATTVRPAHGNLIAQETIAGTMHMLEQIELGLFRGDSSLDALQWDSVDKLIADRAPGANIIDLRGQPLTQDMLIDAALTIQDAPNYGVPTHLFLNPKVKADLVKSFFPAARYDLYNKSDSGMVGLETRGFTSPAGDVMFEPNTFLRVTPAVPSAAVGDHTNVPAVPSLTSAVAGANPASLFVTGDAGNYIYQIVAVNKYGQSAPVASSAVTVAAGDRVVITLNDDDATLTVPASRPTYYRVFRTEAGGAAGTAKEVIRVARTGGGTDTVINDDNETLPNTTNAYMFQLDRECMSFLQLAPMVKVPLAIVNTQIRWQQLLYGAPVVYTPSRNVIFRNVGRASGYVGSV